MRLKRSLRIVPVVDSDDEHLYDIDRQTAIDLLSAGLAINVEGKAIRMSTPGAHGLAVRAGSLECIRENVAYYRKQTPSTSW